MRKLRTQISAIIMLMVFFTVAAISFLSNIIINREFEKYIANKQTERANELVSDFKISITALRISGMLNIFTGQACMLCMTDILSKSMTKRA